MKKQKLHVISGFPGVGKSFTATQTGWHDSDSSTFSWRYVGKNKVKERHPQWPQNYIKHIKKLKGVVMVSTHKEVRDALAEAGIPFVLCYPTKGCKRFYMERYKDRGSPQVFIELMDKNFTAFRDELASDTRAYKHVKLHPGQHLADIDWQKQLGL